jgi:uncharacterized membrane protein (DUF106 family)
MFEIDFLQSIPYSMLFMFALAASISLLTTLVNRLLTNPEKNKAWRKEISEWNAELRSARKEGDKKRLEKVMKKQQYIMQLQSKMSWQSMKVSLLFIVPLFLVWQVLGGFFGGHEVAYFPGIGPSLPVFAYSLIWWYLLCSLLFGTLFSRAFGLIGESE